MTPALLALLLAAAPAELRTTAEETAYARTGRHVEVERLCAEFPQRFPGRARCLEVGVTPEGRRIVALVASDDGVLDPAAAKARGRPVVLLVAGIHAGEIEGKDAGLRLLRELLTGAIEPGALAKITVLFVPIFNVDGHERFAPNQRPNQLGPEETGFRTTAQGLNLNRDWVKADAPEMRAMLALLGAWDPVLTADLHATDGAKFRHDVAVLAEPTQVGPEPLRAAGRAWLAELLAGLTKQGHLPLDFYPEFVEHDDPASGFERGFPPPRFSTSYGSLRNRFSVLVEAHSWRPYAERVQATFDVTRGLVRLAAREGARWRALQAAADRADREAPPKEVVLAWGTTPVARTIEFQGYAYERVPSELSGKPWIRYDDRTPAVWRVPLREELLPRLVATLPGGWIVPAAHAERVGALLSLHGFTFERLEHEVAAAQVEAFRAKEAKLRPTTLEGRASVLLQGAWANETIELRRGALWVPAAQPGVRLLAQLLEPMAPDSIATWGGLAVAWEHREYVEDYLLEAFGRELLAKDPAVKAAFEAKLKDPAFAADPAARLAFFHERHPARDRTFRRYPIFRAVSREVLR